MSLRVVTFNINSIRARAERFFDWLERNQPEVLCLQETKVVDEDFPREGFEKLGYSVEVFGQKTYNGVAMAAKAPLQMEDVVRGLPGDGDADEKRVIAATVGGFRIIDLYVVNGKSVGTPHFEKKLAWLDRVIEFVRTEQARGLPLIVTGDFNIAPEDKDIWNPDKYRDGVLCSPPERERLQALQDLGLQDLHRKFDDSDGLFTWWDYRGLGFQKREGWRIDLFLTDADATALADGVRVDKDERRKGKIDKPSDHAPVEATFRAP